MCGRAYSTYTDEELYFRYLNRKSWSWPTNEAIAAVNPNYNMCPTQTMQILCLLDDTLGFKFMRWGLVPGWAKAVKDADKYSMINAKAEEIAEKRSYKVAFQKRRCIVPLSGFFEWRREGKDKIPFAIREKGRPIMSVAGIWEHWPGSEVESPLDSFSIVTTASNEFMATIHTRMPVILTTDEQERCWLDSSSTNLNELKEIMKGCAPDVLEMRQVSKLVNSPKNNSPEVLSD